MYSPEVMSQARPRGDYLRYKSEIGATLSEPVIPVTAREWTQDYEWYVHAPIAAKVGMKPEIIEATRDGRRPTGMSEDEEIVYDFSADAPEHAGVGCNACTCREAVWQASGGRSHRDQWLLHAPGYAVEHGPLRPPERRDTPSALPRVVQAEGEHAAAGTADGEPIWDHEGDTPVRPSASIEGKARAPSSTDEVIA